MAVERVLIIANGECPPVSLLRQLAGQADQLIAADGGSRHLVGTGIIPDVIIGDLDSISAETREAFSAVQIVRVESQDSTDLQKALAYAQKSSPQRIDVLGATGARSDHFLGNILTQIQVAEKIRLVIHDKFGSLEKISGSFTVNSRPGTTVSLVSLSPVFGITLRGFRYPLESADFPNGFNGVSNVIENNPATIQIASGSLLLYTLRS